MNTNEVQGMDSDALSDLSPETPSQLVLVGYHNDIVKDGKAMMVFYAGMVPMDVLAEAQALLEPHVTLHGTGEL